MKINEYILTKLLVHLFLLSLSIIISPIQSWKNTFKSTLNGSVKGHISHILEM